MVEAAGTAAADIWEVVATSEAVDTMLVELATTTVAGELITTQAADTTEVASVELACSTGADSVIQDMDMVDTTADIQVMVMEPMDTPSPCIQHLSTVSLFTRIQSIPAVPRL